MLRPKQFTPFYNGARAWLAAGTFKGTSLDDGHGSEATDYDNVENQRKTLLRRSSLLVSEGSQGSNLLEGKTQSSKRAKSYSGKPNGSLATDSNLKSHSIHATFVDGLVQVSSPSEKTPLPFLATSKKAANTGESCGGLKGSLRILPTPVREKLQTELSKEDKHAENEPALANSAENLGFAAASKLSESQNSLGWGKKGDGALFKVRGSSSCSQDVSRQKARSDSFKKAYASTPLSERDAPGTRYGHTLGGRTGSKSGNAHKVDRKFSTCARQMGNKTEFLSPLSDELNRMKIGAQTQASQMKDNHERRASTGAKYKAEPLDKQGCMLASQLEPGQDGLILPRLTDSFTGTNNWQVKSECPLSIQAPSKYVDTGKLVLESNRKFSSTVGRQGKANQRASRNDLRDLVEPICNILRQLRWGSDTETALSKIDRKLSPYLINEVLKKQQDVGLALAFFNWAKRQEGFRHDVHTYTTMVGILGRARRFDAVSCLLEDMVKDGCEPSVVTFNRLIHCHGRANQMGEALQIFEHMHKIGCNPDRVTYCTLIDLHAKAGFLDVAMDMYQQMQKAGLQPDTFTYSVIINCLGKAGELSAAQKVFNEMISRGCIPNLVTYNILIDLHAKSGKYDMALKLYNDMQETGYRPDQVTYSIVMEALGHVGHPEEAELVFSTMLESGWDPDETVYGLLVDMWGKAGNLKKSCEWYNKMLESRVRPSLPTCNSLLGAFLRENLYDSAKWVLHDMQNQGLSPSLQTYTLLLSCYTMSKRQADCETIWGIMASLSHPAHVFLCSLLSAGGTHTRESTSCFFDTICYEDQESKRSFTDAMVDFLHKLNMKVDAAVVWEVATDRQIYPKAVTKKAPKYWAINLHTMSMGTAIVALSRTLSNLKEHMLTTGIVPERIDIITGWGRRSRVTGSSLVKQAVEEVLQAVSSPFRVENGNLGCFVGIGRPLADWLYESDMEQMHLI